MSTYSTACPHCHVALRAPRPFPAGMQLRCPHCNSHFVANAATQNTAIIPGPAYSPPLPPPAPHTAASNRTMLFAGIGAVLLLCVTALGITFLIIRKPDPAPVVVQKEDPKDRSADDEARKKLDEEKRLFDERLRAFEEMEKQTQKRQEFDRLMARAKEAFDQKRFKEAETGYEAALKLMPQDPDALLGLTKSTAALAADTKVGDDQKKRQADYDKLMEEGKKAADAKQYAQAVLSYEAALVVMPNDGAAAKALADAKAKLADDNAEKKKLVDFRARMDAGNLALVAQNFAKALDDFRAAQAIFPGNAEAAKGIQAALNQIAAIQDNDKRQAALRDLLARGRDALTRRRFDEAIEAFGTASKIAPDNADAKRGLDDATSQKMKVRAEFNELMAAGTQAFNLGRFEEAALRFRAASELLPDDPEAQRLLDNAKQAYATLQANEIAYQRFMSQGAANLQTRQFAAAIINFTEALRVRPNDAAALAGLADATRGRDRQVLIATEIAAILQQADQELSRKQYADAIRHYEEVLRKDRDSARAIEGVRSARYAKAMDEGQKAMLAQKYDVAIAAFTEALNAKPGDQLANTLLQRAKLFKKPVGSP
jgi:tetratricopeptide (TPR) repeat protein